MTGHIDVDVCHSLSDLNFVQANGLDGKTYGAPPRLCLPCV